MATGMWDYLNNNEEPTQPTPTAAPRSATPQVQPKPTTGSMWDYLNSTESTQPASVQQPVSSGEPLSGIGTSFMAGLRSGASDLPGQAKKAAQFVGVLPTGDRDAIIAEAQGEPPAPKFGGYWDEQFYKVGQMMPASLGPTIAGAGVGAGVGALGGPIGAGVGGVVGGIAGAIGMGAATGQETKERAIVKGVDPGWAPIKTAAWETLGESVGAFTKGKFLTSLLKPASKAGKMGTDLLKSGVGMVGGEMLPEYAQAYGQATVEKNAGIRPDADPYQEAKETVVPTGIMSLMTGGVGAGAKLAHDAWIKNNAANPTDTLGKYIDQKTAGEESLPGVVPPKEQTDAQGVPIGKKWLVHPGHAQTADAWKDEISNIMAAQEEPAMQIAQEEQEDPLMMERHMGWGPKPEPFGGRGTPSGMLPIPGEEEVQSVVGGPDNAEFIPQEKHALSEGLDVNVDALNRPITKGLGGIPMPEPRAEIEPVITAPEEKPFSGAPSFHYDKIETSMSELGINDKKGMIEKQLEPLRSLPYEELKSSVQDIGVRVQGSPTPKQLFADAAKTLADRYAETPGKTEGEKKGLPPRYVPEMPGFGKETKVPERMEVWEGMKLNRDIISKAVSAYPELEKELITNRPRTRSQLLASIKNHLTNLEKSGNFKLPTNLAGAANEEMHSRAEELGIAYKGPWKDGDKVLFHNFTDNLTKGDFAVKPGENVREALLKMREPFVKAGNITEAQRMGSLKVPTKLSEQSGLAEKTTAIHLSDRPISLLKPTPEGKFNQWSKVDEKRASMDSKYTMPVSQPFAGIGKGELNKLGKFVKFAYSIVEGNKGKTSQDVFAGTAKIPNAVTIENHYDADKDPKKLWAHAHAIVNGVAKQGTNYHPTNVFANLVKQAGYDGFVQKAPVKGETWAVSFKNMEATPPAQGRVMVSQNVQKATKAPKTLKEALVRAYSEVSNQTKGFVKSLTKSYPEAKMGNTVMSAYQGAESSGELENSFDAHIEAPVQTLRALAARYGLEHKQESVVVQVPPNKKLPANGQNITFDFPAGTKAEDIAAAMKGSGLKEYRIVSNSNNDRLSVHYFVFGNDKNAKLNVDQFFDVYQALGSKGTLKRGSVYSELIGKDKYAKTIADYHGETRGKEILAEGIRRGERHRNAEATRVPNVEGIKRRSELDTSTDPFKGVEDLKFQVPKNIKQVEEEADEWQKRMDEAVGTMYRQTFTEDDVQQFAADFKTMPGVLVNAGDSVGKQFLTEKPGPAGVNFAAWEYLKNLQKTFWLTGKNLEGTMNNLVNRGFSTSIIALYPDIQHAMDTNVIYHAALDSALVDTYGKEYVSQVMWPKAEKVYLEKKERGEKVIADYVASLKPGEKRDMTHMTKLKKGIPKSIGHVAVVECQPKNEDGGKALRNGAPKVTLTQVAKETADPEYFPFNGHVIGAAVFDKTVGIPKAGEKDNRVLDKDHPLRHIYPVEVWGKAFVKFPKPISVPLMLKTVNDKTMEQLRAKAKKFDKAVELREDYELTKQQNWVKQGFDTTDAGRGTARHKAQQAHQRLIREALKKGKNIPFEVIESYRGNLWADQKMGLINASDFWVGAQSMTTTLMKKNNPFVQMMMRAAHGELSVLREFMEAKDYQAFAEQWTKDHGEDGLFKLGRTIEFVQDLLPEAGTPVSYVELLKEAQENGWLTEQEWKDSNLINWLNGVEDTSVERDYIVDYLQFRNSVYEQVEYEKDNPERTFLNGVERSFRGHGISVKLSYGKMKDKNMQDFITRLAHLFKQKIHFVQSEGKFQFYGWQRDKDILINVDSKDPHLYVMGHELVHALREQAHDLYDALIDTIKADDVLYGRYLQRIRNAYADSRIANNVERLNEELLGDIVGEFFLDKTFWRKMGENNPTLLSKMYDLLSAVYDKLTKFFHGDASATAMLTDYRAALDKAAEVMSQFSNRMEMREEARAALATDKDESFKLANGLNRMINGVTHTGPPNTPRFRSSDPDVQKRFNEARIERGKTWDKIKDQAVKAKNEFTRHFPWLDNVKDAETIEALYQHEQAPARARSRAIRELQGVTKGLDQNQYEIFRFATILPDFVRYAEAHQDNFKDGLPFGYANLNAIRRDMVTAQIMARQDPKITAAMDKRNSLMNNLRSLLVRANVLPADVQNNQDYFHHQVLAYLGSKSLGEEYDIQTPADIRKHKYGWQMARKGTSKDFNTEYLQAEYEVLAQGYVQLAAVSALKKVGRLDIMPQLQQEAASSGVDIKELIAAKKATGEWSEWQPEKGNFFYRAFTISDRLVENTLKALDDELTLAQEQKIYNKLNNLKQVIALGGKKPTWLIPSNVQKTLDAMSMPTDEALIGKASAFVMKSWKQYILLNPLRAIKYMMNNFTGDLDITFAYDYKIITKFAWQAAKDLWKFSHNQLLPESVKNGILKAERKGVIGTGITAVEIESLMNKFGVFKALTGERQGPWNWYWEKVQAFSNYRENILRLASYRYFQEKVNNNPTGGVHGASNAEAVDKIPDLDDRAAKLARELIGDYGNVSHAGAWIRKHMIPFYSWMEVNGPRYVRLMKNVKTEKEANALGFAVRGTAAKAGLLGVKALGLYAMVMLWNATMFPDEDDELKRNGRKQLHLILGRTADGSVRSIRFQGALSDALNWFGMDQPDKTIPDLLSGKKDWYKQLKESAIAPVNKIVLGSTPFIRTGLEAALGRSLFPDITRPKPIRDRTEHLLRSISLDLPYRYAKGIPTRGKDTDLLGTVFAYTDPGESAYYYTLQKMGEYLNDKGMAKGTYDPSEKSNALYYYKQSIKRGNKELAQEWLDKYKELGGNSKSILESVKKSDPLAFLPIKERHNFVATLDEEDQRTLKDARDWWKKTYKGSSMYR